MSLKRLDGGWALHDAQPCIQGEIPDASYAPIFINEFVGFLPLDGAIAFDACLIWVHQEVGVTNKLTCALTTRHPSGVRIQV